jgi:hypothetical protein
MKYTRRLFSKCTKNLFGLGVAILCATLPQITNAQLSVTGNRTAAQLAAKLVGPGVVVLNPTLNCPAAANGTFTGTSSLGFQGGIVLTSGSATNASSTASVFSSLSNNVAGDAQLTALAGQATLDACVLEFDFRPSGDSVKFDYVFGSEEYTSFTCSSFNDVFGFFISGNQYGTSGVNLATVPGTSVPVSINSINCGPTGGGNIANCNAMGAGSPFCAYYLNNSAGTTVVYNGITTTLTAKAAVTACDTYHLKIAIADAVDRSYDSGVFLAESSLSSVTVPSAAICLGSSTTLAASGGTTYSWSPSTGLNCTTCASVVASPTVTTTYTVTVGVSSSPCVNSVTAISTVTVNSVMPTINAGSGVAICPGSSSTLSATGANTYSWSPATGLNTTVGSTVIASPSTTTTYTVTGITLGCRGTATKTVTVNAAPPPTAFSVTGGGIFCSGGSAVAIGLNGSQTGVNYQLRRSTTNVGASIAGTGSSISFIPQTIAGTYSVLATNASGCQSAGMAGTAVISTAVAPSYSVAATPTGVTCNGGSDGAVVTHVSGTAPRTYVWSNGATTQNLSNVPAGIYTYTVSNSCGFVTGSATVSEPSAISFAATATQPSCSYTTGSVSLTATGGTGTITYSGDATTGVTTGTYNYVATDSKGCTATASATITNPSEISFIATATQPTCSYNTGGIVLSATGGTGAFTYGGDATTGLTTGNYNYVATDENGCTANASASISNPSAISFTATATQPTCSYSTGSVVFSAAGGTGAINYSGDATTGLTTGNYNYVATDANGCTANTSATITNPAAITYTSVTATNISCNNSNGGTHNDGTATVNGATGGTGTLQYVWNNGSATNPATGLTSGTYYATITDANGCTTTTGSATVGQPAVISGSIAVTHADNTYTGGNTYSMYLGYGAQTGTFTETATGGSGYSYSWAPATYLSSTSVADPTFTPTAAGYYTYTVTVMDGSGCSTTNTVSMCVVDARDPSNSNKVILCHVPSGNPGNPQHLSISRNAVPAHLTGHDGDRLGACNSGCGIGARMAQSSVANAGAEKTQVFPNPNTGTFSVVIPADQTEAMIIVTDVTGRTIISKVIADNTGDEISLDLGNVAPGMYLVKVNAGDYSAIVKVEVIK